MAPKFSPLSEHKGVLYLCILAMPFMLLTSVSSASTVGRVLTYFTDRRIPWNDAAELCRSRGSRLLTTDSEDVRLALKGYSESAWSNYWGFNFWTGLHQVDEEFLWQNCERLGNYTPWKFPNTSGDKKCVSGDPLLEKDKFWIRRMCENTVAVAICEKPTELAAQCKYVEHPATEVQGIPPEHKPNILNEDVCQQACLSDEGRPECWAMMYTGGSCYFFRAESMAELMAHANNAANGRAALYVKLCFEAKLNHTSLTVTYNDPVHNHVPWAGCPALANRTAQGVSTGIYLGQTSSSSLSSPSLSSPSSSSSSSSSSSYSSSFPSSSSSSLSKAITTTTPVWSSKEAATAVSMTETPTTTTSPIPAHSVTSDTSTLYEGASSSDATEANRYSSSDVTRSTHLAGGGVIRDTSTRTSMSVSRMPGKTVTVGVTRVTQGKDQGSTVGVSTTHQVNTTGLKIKEWCECLCGQYVKLNEAEKKEFTDRLISSLTVNKSNISSTRRRYESAHDPRPSAQSVGFLGLVLLGIAFGGLFVADFHKLYRDFTCKTARKY